MRSIARQSARLASSSRVRQSARRPPAFHTSCSRRDPRDPNSPPDDHHAPPGFESRQQNDLARAQTEAAGGSGSGGGGDGEGIDAKAADEAKKTGLRKVQRRLRGAQDRETVPEPPPIPEWFLSNNVLLAADTLSHQEDHALETPICGVDTETGRTLFELPHYSLHPWSPGSQLPQKKAEIDKVSKEEGEEASSGSDKAQRTPASPSERMRDMSAAIRQEVASKLGFWNVDSAYVVRAGERPAEKQGSLPAFSPGLKSPNDTDAGSLLRWSFLELETSIRAGFTAAGQARQSTSYAASRVDISLHCPSSKSHIHMDQLIDDLSAVTKADIIRLDANDLADLTSEYVGQGSDVPGSFSTLAHDVFEGFTASSHERPAEEHDEDLEDDEEGNEESSQPSDKGMFVGSSNMSDLRKALHARRHELSKALGAIGVDGITIGISGPSSSHARTADDRLFAPAPRDRQQWEEARLTALFERLLDAPKQKRTIPQKAPTGVSKAAPTEQDRVTLGAKPAKDGWLSGTYWRAWSAWGLWKPGIASVLLGHLVGSSLNVKYVPSTPATQETLLAEVPQRTIVHIRDLQDLAGNKIGDAIIQTLTRIARKRRRGGEEILIIGTTAQDSYSTFSPPPRDDGDLPLRTVTVPPVFRLPSDARNDVREFLNARTPPDVERDQRITEINLGNLQSILRRLRPNDVETFHSDDTQRQVCALSGPSMFDKVLTLGQVHRIALTAIGLSQTHAPSTTVTPVHVGLASMITDRADQALQAWTDYRNRSEEKRQKAAVDAVPNGKDAKQESNEARMDRLKKKCNPHETRLLGGVINPQNIKTGFDEVHAPQETIEALKTLTSLSLLRPDAFKYGVLAQDRLPGLMLYGPSGTGKTLLARAVAKESHATVLEVSGAQIYQKYVGEGEKMVRAVFTLAQKLSPCIVFIDEADAIFGSRGNAGNRNTHREIINQFLREWDGMDLHNVFVMVASNRPFDVDDAVLRRLPRRLLVDLPVAKDRESILKIHLRDETLDTSVSLGHLAEQTPLYSGSDLKNLCVAAALACVREETELAARERTEGAGAAAKYPDRRVLSSRHFDKAIREISASISEDMSSLTAIRKFDERFGDRRGRRKKPGYGFGMGEVKVDESSARVRDSAPPP